MKQRKQKWLTWEVSLATASLSLNPVLLCPGMSWVEKSIVGAISAKKSGTLDFTATTGISNSLPSEGVSLPAFSDALSDALTVFFAPNFKALPLGLGARWVELLLASRTLGLSHDSFLHESGSVSEEVSFVLYGTTISFSLVLSDNDTRWPIEYDDCVSCPWVWEKSRSAKSNRVWSLVPSGEFKLSVPPKSSHASKSSLSDSGLDSSLWVSSEGEKTEQRRF